MKKRILKPIALTLAACCWMVPAAEARTFATKAEFLQAVLDPTTVSFNLFGVGSAPPGPLQLGDVSVTLTSAGSPLIFGPGPFGFTTNFLSSGVQDGGNNVVISFPAGTTAAGMEIVSVFPVTVTATYATGTETVTFSASQVSFLGFASGTGLQSITISAPFTPQSTPIVNVGDITYASQLLGIAAIPTLSEIGLALLTLGLLLAGWRTLRRSRFMANP